MIFAGVLSFLLIGFTAYIALSKDSTPLMRRAAIIALALAGLALAVCSLALLFLSGKEEAAAGPSSGTFTPVQKAEANPFPVLIFTAVILTILVIIILAALRDQKKQKKS